LFFNFVVVAVVSSSLSQGWEGTERNDGREEERRRATVGQKRRAVNEVL
jgi:hypothetical protein